MKIWKRVSAFLCAALLILNLAFYPLRTRATAGALAAVAGVTVLGAYLMASGVYPYISEAGQSLSEWTSDNLQPLLDKYNAYLISIGKSYQIVLNGATPTIKGYMTQGAIVMANDVWSKLREFVQWIQSEYALTDNQTGVELSRLPDNVSYVPFVSSENVIPISSVLQTSKNIFFGIRGGNTSLPRVKVCIGYASNSQREAQLIFGVVSNDSYPGAVTEYKPIRNDYGTIIDTENVTIEMQWGGLTLRNSNYPSVAYFVLGGIAYVNAVSFGVVPSFDTVADTMEFLGGQLAEESAVTVDTTTVAPPEALPADTPWGGLAVQGTSNPAGAVEQGITEREKPVVRPVEVEIGTGTEVDSETGEITENPVVVTPEDVVPTVAALSPPASFISALQTTMTTKFPFCLPFDLFKILQAFYVAPEAPVFFLSFHDPFSDSDFSIRVDLSPWDEVAAVVRNFEAMILLAGFCLNFDKFNVIHLILGGLG